MCNQLKNGNRVYKIPEWGFGYKVFRKNNGKGIFLESPYHRASTRVGVWKTWDNSFDGDGFCFLLTKQAVKDFGLFSAWVVYRIRYRKGLGKRMFGHYMSSLCKEFKILQEVGVKELGNG